VLALVVFLLGLCLLASSGKEMMRRKIYIDFFSLLKQMIKDNKLRLNLFSLELSGEETIQYTHSPHLANPRKIGFLKSSFRSSSQGQTLASN
jgi:hypothetical protein